ncbi:phosphoglycolate phosphatase [Rhizobium sp. RU20A]|uniref:HAD family hydrolase n=1 Tax=Rhizobium sp. RU20A TaxID=1907412 RepID=UPI000956DE35|nr:HAD family hydrolase [Rhizobium sp. RU20A]SIQ10085.1 phosphoglycolate phosphatase [Rhizobium sp. RU20A]
MSSASSAAAPRPLVVFDLDGTLIDTAPDLVASTNHSIAGEGLEPVTRDELNIAFSHGSRAMITRAFALRDRALSTDTLDRLQAIFLEHYTSQMPGASRPFPGLIEALDRLDAAGIAAAVCTNKLEGPARRLLEALDLTKHFAAITGADTFPVRKPHADHLLGTIRLAGGTPETTVMVGDSVNDMLVARNAGVAALGVPFGYTDVHISELSPDHVIDHYDELDAALFERLTGR